MKNTLLIVLIFVGLNMYSQEIDVRIREVYGDEVEKLAATDPAKLEWLTNILYYRTEVRSIPKRGEEKLPLLSTVKLFDANNSNLKRDETFDPVTFNPLKYQFEFSSPVPKKYRVDGTDYVIIIHPR